MPEMLVETEQVRLWIFALMDWCYALITESRGKEMGGWGGGERERLNYALVSVNYSLKC